MIKERDKIGREDTVNRICSLVNNLAQGQHFCLALDGAWGSGKTFVFNMIEETLCNHEEYIVIKYDAWENSFYADPLIAILSCVIDSMQTKLSKIEGFATACKAAGKAAISKIGNENSKVGKLVGIIQAISGLIKRIHKPFAEDTSDAAVGNFKSYQALLREVKDALIKIIHYEEFPGKQNKLILMVDELDRCLPEEQLKILERLHHLFDIPNSCVLVALNMNSIAQNVQAMFGVDGKEYLRKFFDFQFRLNMSADEYLQALLQGFTEKLNKLDDSVRWEEIVTAAYNCLKYGEKKVLDGVDNREITRYYDALEKICNDFGWENLNEEYVFFLILALFIRKNISQRFLSHAEMKENQQTIDYTHLQGSMVLYNEYEMPYFDYVNKYFGVDRENLPVELAQFKEISVAEMVWDFNQIVFRSLKIKYDIKVMRSFYEKTTKSLPDCEKLRRLVMLYGGGEE